jgi:DNA-binding Lrp family transcriptional regulator
MKGEMQDERGEQAPDQKDQKDREDQEDQEDQRQDALDRLDRRILDIIQTRFPLVPRPYAALGEQLGLTERALFDRVRALRRTGAIRRIGANFQSVRLGFSSTLCAAKVESGRIEAFTREVNGHPGVTHNYLRDHPYNVWFTLTAPSPQAMASILADITRRTGVAILSLPASRVYKIRVDFPMLD